MESSLARAYVDLAVIRRNFQSLGPAGGMIPVIKSDAYGHGIVPVAKTLAEAGADFMATATVDEALALRDAGLNHKTLVLLGCKDVEEACMAVRENMVPLVYSRRSLEMARQAAQSMGKPLRVALKFDTGMSRLGFTPEDAGELAENLLAAPGLEPFLAMSHMAASDCPEEDEFTSGQAEKLLAVVQTLKNSFPRIKSSMPASAGILRGYGKNFDYARPGIALYGGNPLQGTERERLGAHLQTAMSVTAPVLQLRRIRAGESVGYGRAFKAERDMKIAVLGIGYADGYLRCFSGRGEVALGQGRGKVLGRVCMGMIMVNLDLVPNADEIREGDPAFILGGNGLVEKPMGINDLALALGTISYEVFCLLGRNEREYRQIPSPV